MTGVVRYNSLLWMCILYTLTWPDLTYHTMSFKVPFSVVLRGNNITSFLGLFTTGCWEYIKTAILTIKIATTVYISMAIPKINQHRTAVNISSKALAKVFKIEFRFLKNRLVVMPMAALLNMIARTMGLPSEATLSTVKAPVSSPRKPNTTTLQKMESTYMNMFCIIMCTSQPRSLSRYSLYTPAKQDANTCTMINPRWTSRNDDTETALMPSLSPEWPCCRWRLMSFMIQPTVSMSSDPHWTTLSLFLKRICNTNSQSSKPDSLTLSYFSFQPVLHDWCNKGCGMCYPVCGMVHIKEPLLLIDKSSLCRSSGFPFSLSEWFLTICLTPYNCR